VEGFAKSCVLRGIIAFAKMIAAIPTNKTDKKCSKMNGDELTNSELLRVWMSEDHMKPQ
jgi:hypothetical protein